GSIGPNPLRYSGSDDRETAVIVRPWKFPLHAMISALFSSTPLTSYAQRRAALKAVSTASAPVFIGNAISLPEILQIISYHGASISLWNAREVNVTRSAWSFNAWIIFGWRCPWLTAE